MSNHHAPWRVDKSLFNGDISPQIYDKRFLDAFQKHSKNLRLVFSTCDLKFLKKNFSNLLDYQNSTSQIPYAVGVYAPIGAEVDVQNNLDQIKKEYSLTKIIFFVFTSFKLNQILQAKSDEESKWDYKINFIRNARYNLISDMWTYLNMDKLEFCINTSSIYVIDFDNFFIDDLNSAIKKEFGSKKLIFSWNSLQSPNKKFPSTLSAFSPNSGFNHAYKSIKAGFSAFSPNSMSRFFLKLYQFYSIGDPMSLIFVRLFTFYFSDQVALLLVLNDIKANYPVKYSRDIGWIDIATSRVINLNREDAGYMWYPKGKTLSPKYQLDELK